MSGCAGSSGSSRMLLLTSKDASSGSVSSDGTGIGSGLGSGTCAGTGSGSGTGSGWGWSQLSCSHGLQMKQISFMSLLASWYCWRVIPKTKHKY